MNLFWGIDHELAGRELSAFAFKWREGKSRSAIMNEKIYFYVYSSTATKAFTQAELLELLKRSREKNSLAGLTGMLLYKNGDFMQVLEGPNQAVHSLIETIRQDARHHNIVKLLEGNYPERQFPYWHMGFRDLNTEEAMNTPGYTEFLNTPLSVGLAADPTVCQRLLHLFKEHTP
jgi:hypothetical protein